MPRHSINALLREEEISLPQLWNILFSYLSTYSTLPESRSQVSWSQGVSITKLQRRNLSKPESYDAPFQVRLSEVFSSAPSNVSRFTLYVITHCQWSLDAMYSPYQSHKDFRTFRPWTQFQETLGSNQTFEVSRPNIDAILVGSICNSPHESDGLNSNNIRIATRNARVRHDAAWLELINNQTMEAPRQYSNANTTHLRSERAGHAHRLA